MASLAIAAAVVLFAACRWARGRIPLLLAARSRDTDSRTGDYIAVYDLARRLRLLADEITVFYTERRSALNAVRPGRVEHVLAALRRDADAHLHDRREDHRRRTMRLFSERFAHSLNKDLAAAARLGVGSDLVIDVSQLSEPDLVWLPGRLNRLADELEAIRASSR